MSCAVLNESRRNDRLYVRLLGNGLGAIVEGEALTSLPPSVLAVVEADREGAGTSTIRIASLGEWAIPLGQAVTGSRTLSLILDD